MPPSADDVKRTIETALTMLGVEAETIERRPSATIVPPSVQGDTADDHEYRLLEDLKERTSLSQKLDLHETLGEGGMGIVRLGTQRALARKVAVKTLRPEMKGQRATMKLLREAWVTGSLEHPNVVPIYDVALEEDGSPLIVLKKIEGTSWDQLMHAPDAVQKRFGVDDLLEWNLRILLQVCNAVRFAHSRGVLHRDLKPENVMIGAFGEVYLVDWGIAVSLSDDDTGRLPLAAQALEMAGTPLYMAPEMLGGKESRLSERTDVYLLGAILYEIVVGHPPHRGTVLMEIVGQILDSNPPIPEAVPGELTRVIRRAMDADPDGRFESSEQLRLALQGFLQHRDAAVLAERADERLEILEELLRDGGEADDVEEREPIYHVFGECRFGYLHALEVWPESEAARAGLTRATHAMVEYELAQGEPEAARTLLTELAEVPEALVARVDQARRERRADDARLQAVRDENDPSAGRRTRAFLAILLAAIWSITPIIMEVLLRRGVLETGHVYTIGFDFLFLATLGSLGVWARESMTRTRQNRLIGTGAILAMLGQLVLHGGEHLAGGADMWVTFRHDFVVWSAIMAMMAAAVDWRLLVPAFAFAAGHVVLAFFPRGVFIALAICDQVLLWTFVFLWARREDVDAARQGIVQRRARRREWLRKQMGPDPTDP